MDFTLSKEHEMVRTLFKEFAQNEVKPLAQEVDETENFPRETVEKMAKLGFMGIPIPKEYGGQGCDILTYAMCVEELSKVCGTTGVIVSAHTSLCCDPILTFGTEEQKQKYLVPLAKGEKLGAFGLTEPGAGTDAQGQQTKAVLDGDEYVLLRKLSRPVHSTMRSFRLWLRRKRKWLSSRWMRARVRVPQSKALQNFARSTRTA